MALSDIKITKRKPRAAPKSADEKYLGGEPIEIDGTVDSQLRNALNWYNYFYTVTEGKPWLLQYVKENYSADIYNAIKLAPNWTTSMTSCSLARMLNNGITLPERTMEFLDTRIRENASKAKRVPLSDDEVFAEAPKEKKVQVNPWKLLMRKVAQIMTSVEEEVDKFFLEGTPFDLYGFFKANDAPAQAAHEIQKYFSGLADEMIKFKEDFDGPTYKSELDFYKQMVSDCKRFLDSKKTERKPQKVAKPTTEKLVRKVKYKKEDSQLKITSINPTNIVGARVLVTFHTKHRKLAFYYAKDDMGLSIKPESTTLINYDEKKSQQKTIRSPEAVAKDFMNCSGIRAMENWRDSMPYPTTPALSRLSEDILLLKVVR